MNIEDVVRAVQKELGVAVDGRAGPETWGAIYARIVPAKRKDAPAADDAVDSRSEDHIRTLLPEVKPYARALVHKAAAAGITIKVIGGTRSYAEQDALYAQGRTAPGKIVTKARGGESNHNFGLAFDIGVFEGGRYLTGEPADVARYQAVGVLGLELGLDWGGTWTNFEDLPHFQLRPAWAQALTERQMLAALRARHGAGEPLFA